MTATQGGAERLLERARRIANDLSDGNRERYNRIRDRIYSELISDSGAPQPRGEPAQTDAAQPVGSPNNSPPPSDGVRSALADIPVGLWADRIERTTKLVRVQDADSYRSALYAARIDCFYDFEAKKLVSLLRSLAALRSAPVSGPAHPFIEIPLTFSYRNHRGEVALRNVFPVSVRFGTTEWHPEAQWLLKAFDRDKQAEREFAMRDISVPAVGVTREAIAALKNYQQADADGVMVTVSRQALDEAILALSPVPDSPQHVDREATVSARDGVIEQPGFDFYECKVCGFSSVQPADFKGSDECPICAGDCGHSNIMSRRTARSTDKPEGKDARSLASGAKPRTPASTPVRSS